MKLNNFQLLAFATSAAGLSEQLIKNYCASNLYLTIYSAIEAETNGPFILEAGQAWVSNITGKGNTATVTNTTNVWTPVPKLVLGTSTDNGILYWSVNNVTGDPFAKESFAVTSAFKNETSPNICQNATTYDAQVHACKGMNVTLTLSLC